MGMNNVMECVISIKNQPWKEIEMKLMDRQPQRVCQYLYEKVSKDDVVIVI